MGEHLFGCFFVFFLAEKPERVGRSGLFAVLRRHLVATPNNDVIGWRR